MERGGVAGIHYFRLKELEKAILKRCHSNLSLVTKVLQRSDRRALGRTKQEHWLKTGVISHSDIQTDLGKPQCLH